MQTPTRRLDVPPLLAPGEQVQMQPYTGGNQLLVPPSAFEAGLSPSPFTQSLLPYSQAFGGGATIDFQQQQQSQQSNEPVSALPTELSPDEQSWLQYVRQHELLPYIDNRKAAGTTGEKGRDGTNSASASSSNVGSLLDRRGSLGGALSPGASPTGQTGQQQKSVGFALVINKITGIRIPPHVESKEPRSALRFRVQVSFFDTLNKRFFGRTWVSPLHQVGTNMREGGLSIAQQVLYYRSSLYSEYCLAVVEYVLCVVRQENTAGVVAPSNSPAAGGKKPFTTDDVIIDRYAIGWTVLTLFSRDLTTLTDINDPAIDLEESLGEASLSVMDLSPAALAAQTSSKLKRRQLSKKLWAGTPRALLFMEPINFATPQAAEWTKKLTQAVGQIGEGSGSVTLMYELFTCRALAPFFHLFREFEVLSTRDVLAGLPLISGVTNPLGVTKKFGRTKGACLPGNPRDLSKIFLPVWTCKLLSPSLLLPAKFESRMLEQLTQIKIVHWGGGDLDAPLSQPTAPLERSIISRTLVVGIHNGRRFLRAPYKLPLVLAAPSATPRDDDVLAQQGPQQLRFEGEFHISDLMCDVAGDPSLAFTFELQYEVRWNKLGTPHLPLTSVIVAGWTCRLMEHMDFSRNIQTFALQRGPGRTLANQRVYGFADEVEEQKRKDPSQIISLSIAMDAQGFGGNNQQQFGQQQNQQLYAPNRPTVDMSTTNLPLVTPSGVGAQWVNPMESTVGRPGINRAITSPNRTTIMQPHGTQTQPLSPNAMHPNPFQPLSPTAQHFAAQQAVANRGGFSQTGPQNFGGQFGAGGGPQGQFSPFVQTSPHAFGQQQQQQQFQQSLNLQPAFGLSVGIQTGPELEYESVLEKDLNSTGVANELGTTQGYSKTLGASRGGARNVTPTVLGKPISLLKELSDPLHGSEFLLSLTGFSQTVEDHLNSPISCLIFRVKVFQHPLWTSGRIQLQVQRDLTYDPYNPQAHQLYNQADKLHSSLHARTVTTNPFNARVQVFIPPALHRLWVEYLYTSALEIEVWDGVSLFQIGSARLPLAQTLRQGTPQIERAVELPVIESRLRGSLFDAESHGLLTAEGASSSPLSGVGSVSSKQVKGRLQLSFVHVGLEGSEQQEGELEHVQAHTIPSVSSSKLTNWTAIGTQGGNSALVGTTAGGLRSPSKSSSGNAALTQGLPSNVSLNTTINRPSRRRVKTVSESSDTDPNFLATLSGRQGMSGVGLDDSMSKTVGAGGSDQTPSRGGDSRLSRTSRPGKLGGGPSPIHRQEILSASMSALGTPGEDLASRAANLRKIRQFRERSKESAISSMLRSSHSAIRTIYPTYGGLVFFELAFTNPYSHRTRFRVRIDDPLLTSFGSQHQPECTVVEDVKEWLYLKQIYGLNTPTSITMFSTPEEPLDGALGKGVRNTRRQDLGFPQQSMRLEEEKESFQQHQQRLQERDQHAYIVLEGGETAYIPVKFQSFNCGDVSPSGSSVGTQVAFPTIKGARVSPNYEPIMHRILQVNVETIEELSSTIAYLRVDVRPQAFQVERTLRFHHWSDDILKGVVELPKHGGVKQAPYASGPTITSTDTIIHPSSNANVNFDAIAMNPLVRRGGVPAVDQTQTNLHITSLQRVQRVNCSSDEVAFSFREPDSLRPGQEGEIGADEVSFKLRVASYPSLQRFFLCMYSDVYSANLVSIVEVVVHSHLRAELSAVTGQRTTGRIFLPSTDRPRRVHMASSSPELTFSGSSLLPGQQTASSGDIGPPSQISAPFLLQPGQVNTLDYVYHTSSSGKRSCLIHLIDLDSFDLVQSWCLYVQSNYPKVNNVFNVSLKCGQGARKAFDYENSYKIPRTYFFESSAPDRMKLREEMVQIPPLAVRSIHLVISPQSVPGTDVIFVFINDEKGKNEECLQFNVTYRI